MGGMMRVCGCGRSATGRDRRPAGGLIGMRGLGAPRHRQEADPSMLASRRVSAISPPLFQLGGCLLTSYQYPIHFHTAGRHRMILGAAARGDGSTGSLCSEPFFGVPTPDGGRPPLHCAPLHASLIVDVASRSAADRGMQSSLQRFEAC